MVGDLMKYSAVIPCGGVGSRLNLGYNKILYKIDGKYLIERTVKNFLLDEECLEVIIVYQENDYIILKNIFNTPKIKLIKGGNNREESVYNGVKISNGDYVLIHDGARPNIKKEVIQRIKNALNNNEAVIPVVKSKDASLINNKYHFDEVKLIQTPQAFKKELLLTAMENVELERFKDDGSIYSYYYQKDVTLVDGDYSNIKVTTQEDLDRIED